VPGNPRLTGQQSRLFAAPPISSHLVRTYLVCVCAAGWDTLLHRFDIATASVPRTLSWHTFYACHNSSQRSSSFNTVLVKKPWGRTSGPLLRVLGRRTDVSITPIDGNDAGVRSPRELGEVCLIDHQYSTSVVVGRQRVKLLQSEVQSASSKVTSKSYSDETTRPLTPAASRSVNMR